MKKKLFRKSAVCVLASVCMLSQSLGVNAAALSGWKEENGVWKHYNESGNLSSGWISSNGLWYYIDSATGTMKQGWLDAPDGSRYFLDTEEGDTAGKMLTGWQWIDGYCYFFDRAGGKLVTNAKPEGYKVNAEGQWVDDEEKPLFDKEKGVKSTPQKTEAAKTGQTAGNSAVVRSGGGSGSSGGGGGSSSRGGGSSAKSGGSSSATSNKSNEVKPENKPAVSEKQPEENKPSVSEKQPEENKPFVPENQAENENKPSVPDHQGKDENPVLPDIKEAELLDKKATRVITREIGWIKYVSIAFNQGKASDYNIYVDGTDISSAVTNVDTEGTIVKWLSTVKEPKRIKVVRKSDNLEDTAVLNKGEAAVSPEAGSPDKAPKYVFSNGPISTFDYNLDNYDKNGNIRKSPTRTTFSLDTAKEEKVLIGGEELVYYSPDIKIDAMGRGSGEIKFSLKNKAQEDWFNGITNIKALDYQYWHLNSELNFSKEVSTAYGKTGVIKLSFPQSNLATRGKYNLSIESSAADGGISVPMHLIDAAVYRMQLSGSTSSPRTGENILFNIISDSGRSFGNTIKNPITRVVLTKPSGAEKDLENIKEYSLIGDLFHIYGQDKKKKTVLLDEAGIYTVTIYAEGYSVISTKVEVAQGDAVPANAADASLTEHNTDYDIDALIKSSAIDTISGATGSARRRSNSSGGGISSGTEALVNPVNGYYLFNHDLLINALILNDIKPGNPDATAVARRWLINQKPALLVGDDFGKLYDFDKYLNYVRNGRLNGEEPDFSAYISNNTGNDSTYTAVKYRTVLEDGLLGELKNRGDAIGKESPALEGTVAVKGQNFVLTSQDADYIAAIKSLVVDGNSSALRSDSYLKQYSISEDKKTLTIYPSAFNSYFPKLVGKHTLRIEADGYQANTVTLTITNELEAVKFELKDNPKAKEGEDKHKYYTGQDVYINAASEVNDEQHGSYLKAVYEVTLDGPGLNQRKVTSETEGALYGQDNYLKKDGSLVLQGGLFNKPGQYTVYVKAGEGYAVKTLSFEISSAAEDNTNPKTPEEPETPAKKAAPTFKSAELISSMFSKHYLVEFDGLAENEIEAYLRSKNIKVFVNDVEYSRGTWGPKVYSVAEKGGNGVHKYLQLSTDEFTKAENTVRVEAEGYETLTFNIRNTAVQSEEPKTPEEPETPAKKKAPAFKTVELKSNWLGEKYYLAEFEGLSDNEIVNYFKVKNKKVFVNDVEYKERSYSGNAYWIVEAEGGHAIYKNLKLSTDAFTKAENTVKIEAEGYETLTFNVRNTAVQPEEPKTPEEPEAPAKKAAPTLKKASYKKLFFNEYYLAEFEGLPDNEIVNYFKVKNKKVFVNDVEYKENSYRGNAYWIAEAEGGRAIYKNLKLSTDAFTKAENTVKIEVEGYEDLVFTVENTSVAPEQPQQKAAPEIEALKFVAGAYYPKMPARYEIEFKDADSEEVAEYIKDNNFTIKVNEIEYSKKASVSGNDAQAFALEKANGKTKFYLTADGFDRATNTLSITKEGYAELSFEFEKKYEIKEVELITNYLGKQYLEVRFGDVDRKELEYFLKDKKKVKVSVNGQEYKGDRYDSSIPRKGEFSYAKDGAYNTPKAIKLPIDDLDLSSVDIVVNAEGFAEVSYHYSSNSNQSSPESENAFVLNGAANASLFGSANSSDALQNEALEEKKTKDLTNEVGSDDSSSNIDELFDNFVAESEN